jgi:hypothetical protein
MSCEIFNNPPPVGRLAPIQYINAIDDLCEEFTGISVVLEPPCMKVQSPLKTLEPVFIRQAVHPVINNRVEKEIKRKYLELDNDKINKVQKRKPSNFNIDISDLNRNSKINRKLSDLEVINI